MDLYSLELTAYRRFLARTIVRTNGKLVAVLGPNEAGKSSLLRAIEMLGDDEPPADEDFARGGDQEDFRIVGNFFLSEEDAVAAGLVEARWLRVVKQSDGMRRYGIGPVAPVRDSTTRNLIVAGIGGLRGNDRLVARLGDEVVDRLTDAADDLGKAGEDLSSELIEKIAAALAELSVLLRPRDPAAVRGLPLLVEEFKRVEEAPNPAAFARSVLKGRLPDILLFDEEARSLASAYGIAELSSAVPKALRNLCALAELDISRLIAASSQGREADVTTIEHAANEALRLRAERDWQQSGVRVSLRVANKRLLVQVVDRHHAFTTLAERSDGLRQFVALQAFATGRRAEACILLIDEADQRLHYDAQADLVQMLARQRIADKVVYTTHSAGCLPEDLGNGVRLVQPLAEDEARSRVVNKFWADDGNGLSPLLFGMGAATLAFFPTRNAVLVEGPGDMLLLPSMFREALGTDALGFQFVPGLSTSADEAKLHVPALGRDGGIFYLVDGDGGGANLRNRLLRGGVDAADVFTLDMGDGTAVEPEDFLEPTLLVDGVNALLAQRHAESVRFTVRDFASRERMAGLEVEFRRRTGARLSKVDLAYEILDLLADDPPRLVLAPRRRARFTEIAAGLTDRVSMRRTRER